MSGSSMRCTIRLHAEDDLGGGGGGSPLRAPPNLPGTAIAATRRDLTSQLSPTQRVVLEMLLSGWSQPRVAEHLARSTHTVHDHTKAIYQKLGVKNRVELLLLFAGPARGAGSDTP